MYSMKFSEILNVSVEDTRFVTPENIKIGSLPRTGTTTFGVLTLDALPLSLEENSLNDVDFTTVFFSMTETLRVAIIRNTNNGNNQGSITDINTNAVRDVAYNVNPFVQNVPVAIVPDRHAPTLVSCSLNYSTGILLITFSETIDIPIDFSTTTNLQYVGLQNISGVHASTYNSITKQSPSYDDTTYPSSGSVLLEGSTLAIRDSHIVHITLLESQRATAIAMSGVVGGDGNGIALDIFAPTVSIDHAFFDVAQNPVVPKLNVEIMEHPDVVLPTLLSININYMSGLLQFTFDETIDATPSNVKVILNEIKIKDWRDTSSFLLGKYIQAKERRSEHREWSTVVFDFYDSSFIETCFVVFVTYLLFLKHPNKSFLM